MTLLQIKYFESVCRCKNTLKAAEDMNVSQSTISIAIKRLEEELQVTLFNRSNKGLEPTEAGIAFLGHAKKILADVADAEHELTTYAGSSELTLGLSSMLSVSLLPQIYAFLLAEHSTLHLTIKNTTRAEAIDLIDGEIDAFIATFASPDRYRDKYNMLKLGASPPMVLCISSRNALASQESLSFTDFLDMPLVRLEHSNVSHINSLYQKYGKNPVLLQACSQISTMVSMISSDLAAGFLNSDIVKNLPGIRAVPVPDLKPVDYYMLYNSSDLRKKSLRQFVQLMEKFSQHKMEIPS